ncbi:MAG TPA: hypothetical protein VGK73_15140 [Polyangiaceae bacterium]
MSKTQPSTSTPANAGSDRKERTGVRASEIEEAARRRRLACLGLGAPRPMAIADQRIRRGL